MLDPMLIFFVVLAAVLSYRLFMVLGTRGGHEPEEREAYSPRRDPQNDEAAERAPRVDRGPVPAWVHTVRESYPEFDPDHFLSGAKAAYEMIVTAFAKGDLTEVRPFLDAQVMKAFEIAVEGRQNAGQSMDVTFVGIEKAEVIRAEEMADRVEVTVAFQSDQTRVVRDANGKIVDGDPNRIDLVRDHWTFSRAKSSRDPNWVLLATQGGETTATPAAG